MLLRTTSMMSDTGPSLGSIYGKEGLDAHGNAQQVEEKNKSDNINQPHHSRPGDAEFTVHQIQHGHFSSHQPSHPGRRRGSNHSAVSYSTDSSPTTTNSTFDSPLVPDMPSSPSSSPESATMAVPPKPFQPMTRSVQTQTIESSLQDPSLAQPPIQAPTRPAEDARKNVKGLTLDISLPSLTQSSIAPGGPHPFSAPTSPLREPPKTGRRKPANLTIRTPGFNQLTFGRPLGDVPPTPSQKGTFNPPLAPSQLPSLTSPGLAPAGGMHLTLPNIAAHVKGDPSSSRSASSAGGSLPSLREEEYQPPQSQEVKERGYTDGPVRIYDSGVYLYLEPTAEEACQFDTVINVAKEVKVPFDEDKADPGSVVSAWRQAGDRRSFIEPQTAMSEISFKSAFEWPSPSTPTASTPRPRSLGEGKKPEYLHVLWDHNSEILEDLYPLCQLIDDRIHKGRRVLIHCQLGVSRSASLIIAYGLYKGYEKDFHSMYMAVKQRSRWVGPNMSLIYQLTDFRTKCAKGDYECDGMTTAKAADPEWWVYSPDAAQTPIAAPSAEAPATSSHDTGLSRSLSGSKLPLRLDKDLPPVPPAEPVDKQLLPALSDGPVAQTYSTPRPTRVTAAPPSSVTPRPFRAIAPRPLPLRESNSVESQNPVPGPGPVAIPAHRPTRLPGLMTFTQPAPMMDLARGKNEPATPSLFSPRATEFVANPFGITTAGDVISSAPKRRRPPPGAFPGGNEWRNSLRHSMDFSQELDKLLAFDPRSPHHTGEQKEIIRNINDVL